MATIEMNRHLARHLKRERAVSPADGAQVLVQDVGQAVIDCYGTLASQWIFHINSADRGRSRIQPGARLAQELRVLSGRLPKLPRRCGSGASR